MTKQQQKETDRAQTLIQKHWQTVGWWRWQPGCSQMPTTWYYLSIRLIIASWVTTAACGTSTGAKMFEKYRLVLVSRTDRRVIKVWTLNGVWNDGQHVFLSFKGFFLSRKNTPIWILCRVRQCCSIDTDTLKPINAKCMDALARTSIFFFPRRKENAPTEKGLPVDSMSDPEDTHSAADPHRSTGSGGWLPSATRDTEITLHIGFKKPSFAS